MSTADIVIIIGAGSGAIVSIIGAVFAGLHAGRVGQLGGGREDRGQGGPGPDAAPRPVTAWLGVLLTAVGVLLVPALVLLVRGAVKWTRVEMKLDVVTDKLAAIVSDKDRTHAEMLSQMKEDRSATNRRLEMLERIWIERGISQPGRPGRPAAGRG